MVNFRATNLTLLSYPDSPPNEGKWVWPHLSITLIVQCQQLRDLWYYIIRHNFENLHRIHVYYEMTTDN